MPRPLTDLEAVAKRIVASAPTVGKVSTKRCRRMCCVSGPCSCRACVNPGGAPGPGRSQVSRQRRPSATDTSALTSAMPAWMPLDRGIARCRGKTGWSQKAVTRHARNCRPDSKGMAVPCQRGASGSTAHIGRHMISRPPSANDSTKCGQRRSAQSKHFSGFARIPLSTSGINFLGTHDTK